MFNETEIKGNTNIVIQGVTDSTITLQVNGELQEIQSQLISLKQLLEKWHLQQLQYGGKVYHIQHFNEENFGFWIGKKVFNEHLTKSLMLSIQSYSNPAQRFLQKAAKRPNWESEEKPSDKAKEIIAYSFVGIIGIQLSKLMAIGKEKLSEKKQYKYIQKCLHIIKRTFDLVNFSLLSHFWDAYQQNNSYLILKEQRLVLQQRLDNVFELSILEQFQLLKTLQQLLIQNNLSFPIQELAAFSDNLQEESTFHKVCQVLQQLNKELDKNRYNLLRCFEAETQLAAFLDFFPYLVQYKMASIKHIGYRQIRDDTPHYLHRYTALGIDSKANVDAEKVIYTPETIYTDAVLLYKGEAYWNSTNLFPFVIDYNALTFEYGAKICFYHAQNLDGDKDCLEYQFLEDNHRFYIEGAGILKPSINYNKWMVNNEKRKQLNLDCVVVGFQKAKKAILGDENVAF